MGILDHDYPDRRVTPVPRTSHRCAGSWHSSTGIRKTACFGRELLACLVLSGLVSACGSSSGSAPHSTSPSGSSAKSTSPVRTGPTPASSRLQDASSTERAKSQAIAAYLGMWSDFATAGQTSDWQSPVLARHATAYALQVMEKSLYTDHQNGVITKGEPVDHPEVKSVGPASDPTVVVISDCGDSSQTHKYVAKTGQPAPGGAGGRQAITAEVRRQSDGSWKVDQFAVDGVGSC